MTDEDQKDMNAEIASAELEKLREQKKRLEEQFEAVKQPLAEAVRKLKRHFGKTGKP